MSGSAYATLPRRHASTDEIHANTEPQAMSMFRASPWVTYEPTAHQGQLNSHDMDNDVDMDAPQISTLREEETPPPQPKPSNPRRKAGNKGVKTKPPVWVKPVRKEPQTEEEEDEAEEEEDQLIDDDDDEDLAKSVSASALSSISRAADVTPKRKAPSKRKPRKSEKRTAEDERKAGEKAMASHSGPNPAPTMTWFPATPSESHEDAGQADTGQIGQVTESAPPKLSSSKKRKAPAAPRGKPKPPVKPKTALPVLDDAGVVSEGYTGTAASSPVTVHLEANSPEPEPTGVLTSSVPLVEETNLDNIPLPQYPLPTKPFPVQPPPKIITGFASVIPLDKSRKKVRHWRVANREIRGIAGGRWFARSWVGEKDSEFASAAAIAASQTKGGEEKHMGVALPKLSSVSISAPPLGKGKTKASKASSLAASAAPSRDGSIIPDFPSTSTRPPTKMRTILAPPSDGGDSDMVVLPGS